MKWMIVGAEGQLGRAMRAACAGDDVAAFGHQELDITAEKAVRSATQKVRPNVIVNAASYNNVDGAETEPAAAFAVNETGPRNLALAARDIDAVLDCRATEIVGESAGKDDRDHRACNRPERGNVSMTPPPRETAERVGEGKADQEDDQNRRGT